MSVDLTGTKWYFNEHVEPEEDFYFFITFKSYVSGGGIKSENGNIYFANNVLVYNISTHTWVNEGYRTLTITGGTAVTDDNLANFLNTYAKNITSAQYIVTDEQLTNVANAIRTKTHDVTLCSFPTDFVSAINNIVIPSGTINIASNNTYDVTSYAYANVSVGGAPTPTAGDTPVIIKPTYGTVTSTTIKQILYIQVPVAGTYTFKYIAFRTNKNAEAATQFYHNGIAVDTEKLFSGTSYYQTNTATITCAKDDAIMIYGRSENGTVAAGFLTACIDWDNGFLDENNS